MGKRPTTKGDLEETTTAILRKQKKSEDRTILRGGDPEHEVRRGVLGVIIKSGENCKEGRIRSRLLSGRRREKGKKDGFVGGSRERGGGSPDRGQAWVVEGLDSREGKKG